MTIGGTPEAGNRIRERRIDLAMRQADLAQIVGISPSYLNLIEHNRRRIAGKLLADIARALDIDAGILNDGAEREIIEKMHAAAVQSKTPAEISRTEEIAARYPGWAQLIADQTNRISNLETKVHELTQRMTHDPSLAASLHGVISAVTSIRSAASILNSDEKLDEDWRGRFHKNIHDDAVRLARDSEELVQFLEQPTTQAAPKTALEEVEEWFLNNATTLRSLELDPSLLPTTFNAAKLSQAAMPLLIKQLETYVQDAVALPLESFRSIAKDLDHRPDLICRETGARYLQVLRRLATLAPEDGHPLAGLAICDGSGALIFQRRSADFSFHRSGDTCANWPIFTAMGQLGRPVVATVVQSGNNQQKFRCYALAEQSDLTAGQTPVVRSTMLVLSETAETGVPEIEVGPTCRICPHTKCLARREPAVLGA